MSDSRTDAAPDVRYKAAEVCRIADVQPYVLRYWESEFPVLTPERGLQGPRTYSSRDVKIIERIKKLLYDEGYTIAGAKKRREGELKTGSDPAVAAVAPLAPEKAPPAPQKGGSQTANERGRVSAARSPEPVEEIALDSLS